MALFIVRHEHDADRCPAADPTHGAELLNHLSRTQVNRHGVVIQGEAIIDGAHSMVLILEAPDEERLQTFLQPFAMAGTVEVRPASTCAKVVANGGCLAPEPALDRSVPALDPRAACQEAVDGGLLVHRAHPLNGETSIPALIGGVVMSNARFYVRNHFQIPLLDPSTWRLEVGGLVERPLHLGLRDLHAMRAQTLVVTLECAGNGRSMLHPPTGGEQWDLGAVSTAEWTGVPLVEVLDRAGVGPSTGDVVFRGADGDGETPPARFERSLSVADARDSEAVLAYAMNGEPLPVQHGRPVRLVMPDWYAMASVKWLTEIEVIDRPFTGPFQTEAYVYSEREPVTLQRVRALITDPHPNEEIAAGDVAVRGMAWSGAAPISRVDVSVGGGPWQAARLVGERHRHSWQWWELLIRLEDPGPTTVRARATDLAGRVQPERPEWNPLGYGANAIQELEVVVRPPAATGGRSLSP